MEPGPWMFFVFCFHSILYHVLWCSVHQVTKEGLTTLQERHWKSWCCRDRFCHEWLSWRNSSSSPNKWSAWAPNNNHHHGAQQGLWVWVRRKAKLLEKSCSEFSCILCFPHLWVVELCGCCDLGGVGQLPNVGFCMGWTSPLFGSEHDEVSGCSLQPWEASGPELTRCEAVCELQDKDKIGRFLKTLLENCHHLKCVLGNVLHVLRMEIKLIGNHAKHLSASFRA